MTNYLYPNARGDFYPKTWSVSSYNAQLDVVINQRESEFLAIQRHEFTQLSMIGKIIECVKGIVGFGDCTNQHRVDSELLKFLYHGAAQGLIQERTIKKLSLRPYSFSALSHPAIKGLVQEILLRHRAPSLQAAQESLARMRIILIDYHHTHASELQPSLWQRITQKPPLKGVQLHDFGDTPLTLAKKAYQTANPNLGLALDYFFQAHALQNTTASFQKKLWKQFKSFLDKHQAEMPITYRFPQIQEMILSLTHTAFQNKNAEEAQEQINYLLAQRGQDPLVQRRVGEIYLQFEKYKAAEPYLDMLKGHYANNGYVQAQIGDALWYLKRIPESIQAYKSAVNAYSSLKGTAGWQKNGDLTRRVAALEAKMGQAFLAKMPGLEDEKTYQHAIRHFSEAVQNEGSNLNYQKGLFDSYLQQWKIDSQNFEQLFGERFFYFIVNCDKNIIEDQKKTLKDIFFANATSALKAHRKVLGENYIDQALALFNQDPETVVEAINLCLRHHISQRLIPKIANWNKCFTSHALLKEKIGEIYLNNQKEDLAIASFQHAIKLFEARQKEAIEETEIQTCQERAAALRTRVARFLLKKTSFWSTEEQEQQALLLLEKAAQEHGIHAQELAKTYMGLSEKEKQKTALTRKPARIIEFYQKAFNNSPQNGEYLNFLFEQYLGTTKTHPQAIKLFMDIQKQPWSSEFALSAEMYNKLAICLHTANAKEYAPHIFKCLKKAYELAPTNRVFKQNLAQFKLTLVHNKHRQAGVATNSLSEVIAFLEEALLELEEGKIFALGDAKSIKNYELNFSHTYRLLAEAHTKYFEFAEGENTHEHWEQHAAEVEKVLGYYDKAIENNPTDAMLHFDKAALLDYTEECGKALREYELAVKKCKTENPFYYKRLALIYGVQGMYEKRDEFQKKIPSSEKFGDPVDLFNNQYNQWKVQAFRKDKIAPFINPHTYKIVNKGRIFSQREIVLPS